MSSTTRQAIFMHARLTGAVLHAYSTFEYALATLWLRADELPPLVAKA